MDTQDLIALQKLVEQGYEHQVEQQPAQQQDTTYTPAKRLQNQVEQTLGQNFKSPVYDIIYKQTVEPSEVYGGFQQMTPSCADSQFIILRIKLPGEIFRNLDVEITKDTLTLFGKVHRLHLELPHEVDEKSAKAKFKGGILEVEMKRIDNLE